jgi:putative methionine-R-sulfoxide reductase with GAF domain
MKSYLSTRTLVADIARVLSSNRPSFHHSPLEEVTRLLSEGRHYSWVGIYLTLEKGTSSPLLEAGHHPAHVAMPGTLKKILVSMKIAGRDLGYLSVESDRETAFGAEERVLLERVASLLARFLSGSGKYLVLKASKPRPRPSPKAAAA